ncbi:MAG TPA: antibiotic biosynthesis monooxygenase [Schlesneria sp.]|jgi:heme-degrading monooxygenase HmoA
MDPIASTPLPPYYAVIFTSLKREVDDVDYGITAQRMVELASAQPGYLGMEHVGDSAGAAITISYWSSLEAIENWRQDGEHLQAQDDGRTKWYEHYFLRICRVERDAEFKNKL